MLLALFSVHIPDIYPTTQFIDIKYPSLYLFLYCMFESLGFYTKKNTTFTAPETNFDNRFKNTKEH